MPRTICLRPGSAMARWFAIIVCLLVLIPFPSPAQSVEEAALRQLVERFFAAYQSGDIGSLMALWSEKSPNFAAAKQTFQQTFEANKLELKSLTFGRIVLEGGTGSVSVTADIIAVNAKTGAPADGFGKMNLTLSVRRDLGPWRIWQYTTAEEDLASALVSARTDEERNTLLAANGELLTAELIKVLLARGRNLLEQGKGWPSLPYYKLALEISERNGDRLRAAKSLRAIGNVHVMQGQYEQAKEYYRRSVKLAEAIDDKSDIAGSMVGLGVILHMQGNIPESVELLQRALQISRENGDKTIAASALDSLGSVERSTGNFTTALSYYRMGLEIQRELNDEIKINRTLNNIGLIYASLGNETQALEQFESTLKLSEKLGDKLGASSSLNHIGGIYVSQRNYTKALEYFRMNLAATQELGHKVWEAVTLDNIGLVYQWQGDYARALDFFQKSRVMFEELHYPEGIAHTVSDVGMAQMSLGQYAQAIESAELASTIATRRGFHELLIESRTTAGEAYRALNQPEEARRAFAEAIATVEELRDQMAGGEQQQQRFFENKIGPYQYMVELLIDQKNAVESFAYAERAKGRALLDVLQSGRVSITGAMTPTETEEERRLKADVVSLNSQVIREKVREQPDEARLKELDTRLNKARQAYETMQMNLYAGHPELKVHRGQMEPVTLERAGLLMPGPETALLEYAVTKSKILLFVVTREASDSSRISTPAPVLKVYELNTKQEDLAARVERFRRRLASLDFGAGENARELYDLLVAPARAELQNKKNLIIVPDGVLWDLPFQALQPGPTRYLIEDAAISYAPSLTVLLEMTKKRRSEDGENQRLLAFGNPALAKHSMDTAHSALMDEQLKPLPEAERQVRELSKLYGPQRSRIYVGADAQEARLKKEAAGYRILHLAAHGILNDKNPMYSQVVLSQREGNIDEDGMLEAWEIIKMVLKADLVVLSACETARGKVGNGEGMIGLSWALFVAGVPTTVASQWSVESASTTELMVEFHRNLERHKSKAESLRQAMLKLLRSKEYSRPFYWAGFVVVGNGR